MKVLFVGGTGTISTACARLAIERGIDLWLLVRGTRNERIPPRAHVIRGDIKNDSASVKRILEHHTWDCVVDWVAYDAHDVERDVEFFIGKTQKFFFISTTSVYQKPLRSVFVNESSPIGNTGWEYADKKAWCERLLWTHYERAGFPLVVVRPGYTYAEFTLPSGFMGMGFGIAERILKGKPILIHGDGTGVFTLTFNEDFARAFVPLIGSDCIVGETFQIASDEVLTWTKIYDLIGEALGRDVSYVFASSYLIKEFDAELGASLLGDKAHSYILDTRKIKSAVPYFSALVPFADGVRRCTEWYWRHREAARVNPEKDQLMDAIIDHVERMQRICK